VEFKLQLQQQLLQQIRSTDGSLSAAAPVFVPATAHAGATAVAEPAVAEVDPNSAEGSIMAALPTVHRQLLRGGFVDPLTGEYQSYYLGRLKSFNRQSGYGFIECPEAFSDWGSDVFIHHHEMPDSQRWNQGQPVEFAITTNYRGQPQATDTNWLPWLRVAAPQPRATPIAPAVLARQQQQVGLRSASAGDAVAPQPAQEAVVSLPRLAMEQHVEGWRRLGTLKSFSPSQGYGFIECEETYKLYGRDAYLTRSEMPQQENAWLIGQTVEFAVCVNAKGHPQARNVNWEPVPQLPPGALRLLAGQPLDPEASKPAPSTVGWLMPQADNGQPRRKHAPRIREQLRRLLLYIQKNEVESGIIYAIDEQGKLSQEDPASSGLLDEDIDVAKEANFVLFVLRHLPGPVKTAETLKDFTRMLLILVLARMLRWRQTSTGCFEILTWLQAMEMHLNPEVETVRGHFDSVSLQIENNLEAATTANPSALLEEPSNESLRKSVLDKLRAKRRLLAMQNGSTGGSGTEGVVMQ